MKSMVKFKLISALNSFTCKINNRESVVFTLIKWLISVWYKLENAFQIFEFVSLIQNFSSLTKLGLNVNSNYTSHKKTCNNLTNICGGSIIIYKEKVKKFTLGPFFNNIFKIRYFLN